jgi:EmrB/QacA subfamily drug resistance transporter
MSARITPSSAAAGPPTTGPTDTAVLDPRRWWALPVILVGSFLSFLDFFIVNIALPAMRDDLGARPAELQFVVAGYGIGFSVFLITGGRLGDIFGRKRVFLLALTGFTLASALCGLAATPRILIASRVLQAITAATLVPQVLAIIRVEFPAPERPLTIGLYGTSMDFASIVAQLLGGLLVTMDLFGWSWRLIFLVNIPIGLVAVVVASRMIRESRHPNRPTVDLVGVGLASLGLFLLIYPLVDGREAGWPAWSFAMLLATLPVLVGFVCYERRVVRRGRSPLVALHLFRVATVTLGLVVSVMFFSGLGVFFVVLTVFFQEGFGYSAFSAGLMFLPFAVGFSGASAVSGPIATRIGARIVNLGTFLMILGLLGIIALARLAQPALINTVIGSSGVSGEDSGSAAGLFLTTAQSAIALGVAAIGDVFFALLGPKPNAATYVEALSGALSCNLVLQAATFLMVFLLRRVGRSTRQQRISTRVAPTEPSAADKGE